MLFWKVGQEWTKGCWLEIFTWIICVQDWVEIEKKNLGKYIGKSTEDQLEKIKTKQPLREGQSKEKFDVNKNFAYMNKT